MAFVPPSVPETGYYQTQWFPDGAFYAAAFDSNGISKYFGPFADPQTYFHNNCVTREKLTAPAWKRQVKRKLKQVLESSGVRRSRTLRGLRAALPHAVFRILRHCSVSSNMCARSVRASL